MKRTVCSLPLLLKHLYPLDDDVSLFLKRSFSVRLSLSHYFYINAFKGFLKIDRVIQVDTKWRQITVPLFLGVRDFDAIFGVSNSYLPIGDCFFSSAKETVQFDCPISFLLNDWMILYNYSI